MTNKTKAIEKIKDLVNKGDSDFDQEDYAYELAETILTTLESLGYIQKAEDQSLPETPSARFFNVMLKEENCYKKAQQDMLRAGWVKVKKE